MKPMSSLVTPLQNITSTNKDLVQRRDNNRSLFFQALLSLFLCATSAAPLHAQTERPANSNGRAAEQAEQLVSLSADTIEGMLLREPGLLLEVKKALVRKAYEEGRLLDPADLTDDALFELLRDDNDVRILAT